MFDAVLSFFVTELNNNQNRSVNIRKAAELIDGTVLMPGEVFLSTTGLVNGPGIMALNPHR